MIGANFTAQTLLTAKQTYKQTHKQNKYKETKEITTHTYAHTHTSKRNTKKQKKQTKQPLKHITQIYNLAFCSLPEIQLYPSILPTCWHQQSKQATIQTYNTNKGTTTCLCVKARCSHPSWTTCEIALKRIEKNRQNNYFDLH